MLIKRNEKTITGFDIKCWCLMVIFSLLTQLLTPINDEPDYSVRSAEVKNSESLLIIPQNYALHIKEELGKADNCDIADGRWSLWHQLNGELCIDAVDVVLIRTLILVAICTLILIMNKVFYRFSDCGDGNRIGRSKKQLAVSLSLCMPSMLYYLGLISPESSGLFFGMLSYVSSNAIIPFAIFIAFALWLDLGNGLILVGFYATRRIFLNLYERNGYFYVIKIAFAGILTLYILGHYILQAIDATGYLEYKPEMDVFKLERALDDNIPIILRPIITIITFLYMTPGGVKSIPALIIFVCGLVQLLTIIMRRRKILFGSEAKAEGNVAAVDAISGLFVILGAISVLPDYSVAKYYIFLLPAFIRLALEIFPKNAIFRFIALCGSVLYATILLEYVI